MNIEVPNLDCVPTDDLAVLRRIFQQLANYCMYQQRARQYRLAGEIQLALTCEANCEGIYKALPEDFRW